ncbi:tripartite tricarboxylate transporter substrate binding protein [Pseudorhodoplanes sp.]|uniref:tripartite tricarboxylate transporter substrate binding protein n=1 Tax=Pseudorhodoplanes sp. TaxID=1934341 RepID=UPI00391C245C
MKRVSIILAGLIAAFAATGAVAQTYPTQPVRIVVPFAAGGAVDTVARVVGQKMSESLGQPVVIENRPGAGGNLAADAVARSAPDGYTVLLTTNGHAISPSLYRSLPFDAVKDFIPVTQLIESPLLLVGSKKLEANNVQELIALAKKKPGVLNYGSTGIGNPLHLSMELLKKEAGIDIANVPYKGDAPLNTALISGEVDLAIVPVATGRANVDNKLVKGLAVTSASRAKALPDLPTIAEQGVKGFDMGSWQGFFVPAKTPDAVVQRLYQAAKKALEAPDVRQRLAQFVAEPVGSSPEQFAKKFNDDVAKYAKIVKEANIPQQN